MNWTRACMVVAFLLGSACASARGYDLPGEGVDVDDGDTVVLLTPARVQEKIRLSSIDAPESSHTKHERGRIGQPFSDSARDYLAHLVKGKQVVAKCTERDRYERNVCDIFVAGVSANRQMVAVGLAWANRAGGGRYLHDPEVLRLEDTARRSRLGLWADKHPVEPWLWREHCWKHSLCPVSD